MTYGRGDPQPPFEITIKKDHCLIKSVRLAIVKWHKGSWHGAADPRREGKALGLRVNKNHLTRYSKILN